MHELYKIQETGQQYSNMQPQNPIDVYEQDQKYYTWTVYTMQLYTMWIDD